MGVNIIGIIIVFIVIFLILQVICGVITHIIMKKKGYSSSWFFFGLLLGIIAIVIVALKPDNSEKEESDEKKEHNKNKKIKTNGWKCTFCNCNNSDEAEYCSKCGASYGQSVQNGEEKKVWVIKKLIFIFLSVFVTFIFVGCQKNNETEIQQQEDNGRYSYSELDSMDEVTIVGNKIVFRFYENNAIPYIWKAYKSNSNLSLTEEYTVESKEPLLNAGDSPHYHVFIYDYHNDGVTNIDFVLAYIYSEGREEIYNDASELIEYKVIIKDNKITIE